MVVLGDNKKVCHFTTTVYCGHMIITRRSVANGNSIEIKGLEVSSSYPTGIRSKTHYITETCPCKVYPLKPHFYIEKLGYAGLYLSFLFLLQNIDCGYSLEPPRWGGSNVYPQSMFWAKIRKISKFFYQKFSFFTTKIFSLYCMGMFS